MIIILRYLAAGKMQQCSCDDLDVPQPIVIKYIIDTVNALSRGEILRSFNKFPITTVACERKAGFIQLISLMLYE